MVNTRNRKILDDMQEGYYEIDLNGTFTYVNDTVCKISELPRENLIGMNFREYTTKNTARRVYKTFNKAFNTGIPQRIEYEIILLDGKKKIIENSVSLFKDESGNPIGFCGLVTDVTKRRRLEEQLRENRERFEALFENANEFIITTDAYGYIKRLNKKVEVESGYSRKDMIGQSILMIAHPDDKDLYVDFWRKILAGETPRFELRALSKDRQTVYLLASGSAVKKAGKIVEIQYNAQVISDLKKAQHTIEDLKNYLNSIIESSPNMIICLDRNAKIQMANPITERIFHKPVRSVLGNSISSLSSQMAVFAEVIQSVQDSNVPQFFHEQTLSDTSKQIFDISIYPLMNPVYGGVVFTAVDITEKKHMEVQLVHAQKMETIGELAGGVAHDFNNILTGISGNLSMLRYTTDREKQIGYIETLEKISDRARDLVQQMLVFTRRNEGKPENISIQQVLQEVLVMASKSIPKNIRIDIPDVNGRYNVYMDHTQLTQVLLNLIVNAKDAIDDNQNGSITIDVQTITVDNDIKRQYLLETVGKYIKIDVIDNGCGMNSEILPKVFDPFFSTKEKGPNKGMGLGLSITYNIVKNARGSIQVQSEEGKGSRFTILLPLSRAKGDVKTSDGRDVRPETSRARVLLVDDEVMLREIGKEMLEFLGHEVDTASDGHACLDKLKKDETGFDLIILDMIMPGLDGYHTLKEMERIGSDTKVIISSGFSFEHEKHDILNNPLIAAKLNKPFNMSELSRVLADILT
ncbi:MAG TPA: PAS domain S-box protein [Deltaproteobacteria bacterium]|nr:PAS domain S-box protein [Deltaproteobacteria bacterium]HPJ92443.1 PAS domain S-box protein [Deltaproteobacteria bacterium]HPR50276.1 PAS domain S-box protein [Deltaproteobacteria bacterium]